MGLLNSKTWNEMFEVTHQPRSPTPKRTASIIASAQREESLTSHPSCALSKIISEDEVQGTPDKQQVCLDPRSPTYGIYRTPILVNCPAAKNSKQKDQVPNALEKDDEKDLSLSSPDETDFDPLDSSEEIVVNKSNPKIVSQTKDCDKENTPVTSKSLKMQALRSRQLPASPLAVVNRERPVFKLSSPKLVPIRNKIKVDKENANSWIAT